MEEFGFNTDDLVCELYQPKQKKPIPKVDYTPKIDDSLWFLSCDASTVKFDDVAVEGGADDATDFMKNKTRAEKKKNRKMRDDQNEDDETKNERKNVKIVMRMLLYRSDYFYHKHQYQKCIQDCNDLARIVRHLGDAHQLLSVLEVEIRCLIKLIQYENAVDKLVCYEKIATQPRPSTAIEQPIIIFKDSNIIYLLAQCLHRLGRYSEAIEQYQRAITYNQNIWEWWMNLAQCYLNQPFIERVTLIRNSSSIDKPLSNNDNNKSILCAKRSVTIALYHLMNSNVQKRSLDTKAGWQQPLAKAHDNLTQVYQSLLDIDIKDIINNTESTTEAQQSQLQLNEFEVKWFIQYKDKEVDETEQLEEENPYNL